MGMIPRAALTRAANAARGIIPIGIGPGSQLERVIADKNARIGEGCLLRGDPDRPDEDGDGWFIRDGIVIVPKDASLAPGTTI